MSRRSYQPSHLKYKEWGKFRVRAFIPLYIPQKVISSSTSALYCPERDKTRRTEYDRMILEELQRVTTYRFQSGSRVWPGGRIWYSF